MPRWTTVYTAPYKAVRAFAATCNDQKYKVQMHPADDSRMLVRLAHGRSAEKHRQRFSINVGDIVAVVFGRTSTGQFIVTHVQDVPSWKGCIQTAVITF